MLWMFKLWEKVTVNEKKYKVIHCLGHLAQYLWLSAPPLPKPETISKTLIYHVLYMWYTMIASLPTNSMLCYITLHYCIHTYIMQGFRFDCSLTLTTKHTDNYFIENSPYKIFILIGLISIFSILKPFCAIWKCVRVQAIHNKLCCTLWILDTP